MLASAAVLVMLIMSVYMLHAVCCVRQGWGLCCMHARCMLYTVCLHARCSHSVLAHCSNTERCLHAVCCVLQGFAERGQLHGTTCQRLLLASLLAMTGNIMSLGKVSTISVPTLLKMRFESSTCCQHSSPTCSAIVCSTSFDWAQSLFWQQQQ